MSIDISMDNHNVLAMVRKKQSQRAKSITLTCDMARCIDPWVGGIEVIRSGSLIPYFFQWVNASRRVLILACHKSLFAVQYTCQSNAIGIY
jgi:hypothetical protein